MNDEIDHIDQLKKRLYSRDPDSLPKRKFGILRPLRQNIDSTWGQTSIIKEKEITEKHTAGYKKFFIFAVIFFLIAAGIVLFSYFRGAVTLSSKNVELTILGNSFVGGGEELPIQVEVSNTNSANLENAVLTLNYPKGATDENGGDVMRIERVLGVVGTGKTKSESFTVILYGEQGSSREIKADLSYQLAGSNSVFQKETVFPVMVNSSPVSLNVNAPTAVVSNQSFNLTLRTNFSGDKSLNNVISRIDYPNGFVFQSADPAPISGNNVWSLGNLEKGDQKTISITGKIVGEQNDEKAFRIYLGTPESENSNKIDVVYNSALATLNLTEPFITGNILIDNNSQDLVALTIGDGIQGSVKWINNSAKTITNPIFTLALEGDNIDYNSIDAADGHYDPLDKTITWSGDSDLTLASIAPGATGSLLFSFDTDFTNAGSQDIKLTLSVKGSFPDLNNKEQSIDNIDQKIIKFASNIQFGAQSLFSVGPFKNTGPYPARADRETTYTIMWTILPTDNALKNVLVTTALPGGISWQGVFNPTSENLSYDTNTHIITWNVGTLPRSSTSTKNRTVYFQVKAKPTRSQIGSPLTLINESKVTATDSVTNTQVATSRPALTTRFDTDAIYTTGSENVLP